MNQISILSQENKGIQLMDMRLWGHGNRIFARLHRSDQLFWLLKTGTKSQCFIGLDGG